LQEAPLAIEAGEQLLKVGVSGAEVMTLMVHGYCKLRGLDWVQLWMRALGHLHNGEYADVITALKSLDNKMILRGCSQLSLLLGRAYYLKVHIRISIIFPLLANHWFKFSNVSASEINLKKFNPNLKSLL
jgi:hypothetical protein